AATPELSPRRTLVGDRREPDRSAEGPRRRRGASPDGTPRRGSAEGPLRPDRRERGERGREKTLAAGAALSRCSVTAAHPVVPREVALQTGLQWPERTCGVGESHLLTPRAGVRRRVFPIEPGAAGDVVLTLLERRGRRVDRPERRNDSAPRVPQAGEIARRGA